MKVSDMRPAQRKIDALVMVLGKSEPREVVLQSDGRSHSVCEALVGDETGCVYLSLWDAAIGSVRIGSYYSISNAYTTAFRNSLRLNIGRYGRVSEAQGTFEANASNNLSLREL